MLLPMGKLNEAAIEENLYCQPIDGVAGFTISPPDAKEYRAGYFWDDPSDHGISNLYLPYKDPQNTIWICGAFESWGRGRPRVKRAWNVLELWIEAPNRKTAIERLCAATTNQYLPRLDDLTGNWQFDESLRAAVQQKPLLQCAVNVLARELHGYQERPKEFEDAYYLCVQRLRPGWNDKTFAFHPKHRDEAICLEEQRISLGSKKPSLDFEDLPQSIRDRISIHKRTGCWIWDPKKAWDGRLSSLPDRYGSFRWEGRQWQAHRLVYELLGGIIAPEAVLRHQCHRKRCTNPDHILSGSHRQNRLDTTRRRKKTIKSHTLI